MAVETVSVTCGGVNSYIDKLNFTNYSTWKRDCQMVLFEKNLWQYVDPTKRDLDRPTEADERNATLAFNCIWMLTSNSERRHLYNITNPREAWLILSEIYWRERETRQRLFEWTLGNIKLTDNCDVRGYVDAIFENTYAIDQGGHAMSEGGIVDAILKGLPYGYDRFSADFKAKGGNANDLVLCLLSEEQRRRWRMREDRDDAVGHM